MDENYMENYKKIFDSFKKDEVEFIWWLSEYRMAFLEFNMPKPLVSKDEES